ncbi:isopentenyl-diphosphate Delta-isomerase [Nesterenkonia sp. NBAIMH1]|uniref:isopentenyl-diphosphate Delta-isomerase n=1 Tax=Nesterenkonia sp. NBAIMH1 TaxID=2600320 RepID=UPI0011B8189E|nr:isopentenyl-diphosphate Delta-isomerase [Nesterenkonia sp. NBAIMH1]
MEPAISDQVVLVTPQGEARGTLLKSEAHGTDTPLHLGFSCHVIDGRGRVLVTRRALSKRTWPGVWTNSFCGHPGPGEGWEDAVRRHGMSELGLAIHEVVSALPDFQYRATDASGVVENEICPVFTASAEDLPEPNLHEVVETAWVAPHDLRSAVEAAPWAFSPWMVLQIPQMPLYGGTPSSDASPGV